MEAPFDREQHQIAHGDAADPAGLAVQARTS
jgi:hypothetical protein